MAAALHSEKFYDALGSLSFLSLSLGSLAYGSDWFPRQALLTAMVCAWTLRLGCFLAYRVHVTGGDSRFDEAKHKPGVCGWVGGGMGGEEGKLQRSTSGRCGVGESCCSSTCA